MTARYGKQQTQRPQRHSTSNLSNSGARKKSGLMADSDVTIQSEEPLPSTIENDPSREEIWDVY